MVGSFTSERKAAAGKRFRDHITANPTWGTKGGNVLTHKIDGMTMSQLDEEGEFGQKNLNALINKLSQEVYNRPKSADEIRREREAAADLARRDAERKQFDQWKLSQTQPTQSVAPVQVTPQDIASYNIDASGRTHGKPLEAVRSIEAAKAGTEAIAASVPTATITDDAGEIISRPVVQTDTGPTTSQSATDITDADGNVIQAGNPLMKAQFEALLQRMTDERQAEERFAQTQNARQDQIRQDQIRQQEITLANAERAGREAFAGTQGPRFIAPHIEGNDPVQAATRRALMSQLSGNKFQAMEAQRIQALEDDAEKSREALLGRLSDYGVLTRSGRTIDRLGEFEGQVLRGRGDVRSQMEQLRSQQLANAIEQGRGFREFEVGADLSRAEMINQALAKGSDIDFRRYELQQDVANQAMSRQLALLDPTGREQFQQQIRGQLSEEQLKRTGMDLTRQQYETSKEQFEADRALREGELTGRFGDDDTLAAARFGEESRQFNLNRMRDAERLRLETRGMGLEEARLEGTLGLEQMRLQEEMRVGDLERMMQRSQFEQDRQLREGALTGQYGTATSLAGQEMAMRRQAQEAELFGYVETDTDDPLVQAGLAPSGKRLTRSEKEAEFEREMMREELGLRRGELTGQYGTEDTLGSQEMALRRAELTGRMGEGADAQQTMAAQQWADEQALRAGELTGRYDEQDTLAAQRLKDEKEFRGREISIGESAEERASSALTQEMALRRAAQTGFDEFGQRTMESQRLHQESEIARMAREQRATEWGGELGLRTKEQEEAQAQRIWANTQERERRVQEAGQFESEMGLRRQEQQISREGQAQASRYEMARMNEATMQRNLDAELGRGQLKLGQSAEERAANQLTQEMALRRAEQTGWQEGAWTKNYLGKPVQGEGRRTLAGQRLHQEAAIAQQERNIRERQWTQDLGLRQQAETRQDRALTEQTGQMAWENRLRQDEALRRREFEIARSNEAAMVRAQQDTQFGKELGLRQQEQQISREGAAQASRYEMARANEARLAREQAGTEFGSRMERTDREIQLAENQQQADIRNQSLAMMQALTSATEGKLTPEARRRQAGLQAELMADSMRKSGQFSDEQIDEFVQNIVEGGKGDTVTSRDEISIWKKLNPFSRFKG